MKKGKEAKHQKIFKNLMHQQENKRCMDCLEKVIPLLTLLEKKASMTQQFLILIASKSLLLTSAQLWERSFVVRAVEFSKYLSFPSKIQKNEKIYTKKVAT